MGVTPFYKRFAHDGARGPNMATVYSDRGHGVRAPVVFYNRANEAAAHAQARRLRLGRDLRRRRALVPQRRHLRGAVRDDRRADHRRRCRRRGRTAPSCRSTSTTARSSGTRRAARPRAPYVLGRIVEHVDVLVGNEEDLQKGLGIAGPGGRRHVEARSARVLRDDRPRASSATRRSRSSRRRCARCTRRTATRWGAVAWIDGQTYVAPTCELDVHDRVGGGDGFASRLFYGLLTGETPRSASSWAGRTAR